MSRRKRKLKTKGIFFLLLIVLIIFGIFFLNKKETSLYNKEVISVLKENNIDYKSNYSKTLEEVILNNNYKKDYLNEYKDIKYIEKDNFLEVINKYLSIGYSGKEINDIFKLSDKNQEKLLSLDKLEFKDYINIKNFNIDNLDRYNSYKEKNNIDIKDIVTYVNINLDKDFYTNTSEVKDADSLLVLVNKYNKLPNNYKPKDLVYVPGAYGNNVPFRSVLKEDFEELQKAAKDEINIKLMPTTAFRDQGFQTTLYNKYVNEDGVKAADTYSARPGYSEHQTGLAIDLKNMALSNTRLTNDNYEWLENNAYKYGFIIRFPKDKETITGYQFENWHIRYVGKDVSKVIYDNKLTLEEYIDLYVTEY